MSLRFTDLELLASIVCGITVWLFAIRGRIEQESNWPLVYYLGLIFYQKSAGRFLEANFVYAGVISAMMIRFEFMSSSFSKIFRFIEAVCFVYVIWRCLDYIFFR